ncbi:hypothetical protein GTO27_08180 [Candidatus Bathyarchaeota archaeon]|nr:hypothetical protein [Candidatus Bathyarchaeota archaeon]
MSDWKKSFLKLEPVKGWLFDVYPSVPNKMIVWIITEDGGRVRFVDEFSHKIYVSGKYSRLESLVKKIKDNNEVVDCRFVKKYADFMEDSEKKVLEISINDRILSFARKILRSYGYGAFHLYNVDVPISQAYLYERELFPLAHVMVVNNGRSLCYDILDSVEKLDYDTPSFRSIRLNVEIKKEDRVQKFTDEIDSISLESGAETVTIRGGDERNIIMRLVETVRKLDPDLVFTRSGDSFLFPYLAHRALVNGVSDHFVLSREDTPLKVGKIQGKTFFSYGRVFHRSPMQRLYGRVHVDVDNTFIYTACGLEGLMEVSRTCKVPLHRAARASIGGIMSSLQLYVAWKNGVLVPWKKREPESFKSGWELLIADRGGFIFEPKLGFHTDVVEVDFTSMFPMLMWKHNISAETVLCKCCPDSKLRVPELDYNICERRRGIVPKTLDLLLKKRLKYKDLMKKALDKKRRRVYDRRQAALKWVLVTCFGYLGYRNSRFGKVDAHIAVCAFARDALLKAARMAEQKGFEVIHGIVDSLWLKKSGLSPRDVAKFCREVSEAVDVPLNVEGRYRWIVFLSSKVQEGVPVLNRYYGVFEDGKIKMRGIEARRRDTPRFIYEAQVEMIKSLAKSANYKDFKAKIWDALDALGEYAERLISNQVSVNDLLIAKRLSKSPSDYIHDIFQAVAARQLEEAGFEIFAGKTIRYLIVNSRSRNAENKVLAAELIDSQNYYDVPKYLDMLISAGETLLGIFGFTEDKIREEVLYPHKQTMLKTNVTQDLKTDRIAR